MTPGLCPSDPRRDSVPGDAVVTSRSFLATHLRSILSILGSFLVPVPGAHLAPRAAFGGLRAFFWTSQHSLTACGHPRPPRPLFRRETENRTGEKSICPQETCMSAGRMYKFWKEHFFATNPLAISPRRPWMAPGTHLRTSALKS